MLISIHSMLIAVVFTGMCGLISHLIIAFNGFMSMYFMAIMEMLLNKTSLHIPAFVSHMQGFNMYFTLAFILMVLFGCTWINLKHYQLTKFITWPLRWVWYIIKWYLDWVRWFVMIPKNIIMSIF